MKIETVFFNNEIKKFFINGKQVSCLSIDNLFVLLTEKEVVVLKAKKVKINLFEDSLIFLLFDLNKKVETDGTEIKIKDLVPSNLFFEGFIIND